MTMTRRAFCAGHTSVPLARPVHAHEESLLTAKAVTVQLVPDGCCHMLDHAASGMTNWVMVK
ncbi:hypothetical protein [Tritonibacter mobilis]|uniref:hypothetical protein n=1 Tax=Tritonibacter mobilis TaxID=379347 RepID=UPI000E0CE957|nr:hypothetical protein [Tritonibacter mobilis]NKX37918.1 hypothetical protein [Rhodobacteraceae bacterium R_SAG4]